MEEFNDDYEFIGVTGIVDNQPGVKTVEYDFLYGDNEKTDREAIFVLYDDGWRIDTLDWNEKLGTYFFPPLK